MGCQRKYLFRGNPIKCEDKEQALFVLESLSNLKNRLQLGPRQGKMLAPSQWAEINIECLESEHNRIARWVPHAASVSQ